MNALWWSTWLGIGAGVVSVGGVIWWILQFSHRRFVESVTSAIKPVIYELQPNSGGSIKDQLNRLEERQTWIVEETQNQDAKLDLLTLKIENHLAYHAGVDAAKK